MKNLKGFTLVEAMVTIAVASLMFIAIPNFVSMLERNQQSTQINSLAMAINLARDQAVVTNNAVSVCQSSNGTACTATGWDDGWIVYTDGNTLGAVDGTDVVLQVYPALAAQTTLTSTNFANFISYNGDGLSNASGGFALCNTSGSGDAFSLCVAATGRAQTGHYACGGGAINCD